MGCGMDIQALRAVAILLVLVYHFLAARRCAEASSASTSSSSISGFLITSHLLREVDAHRYACRSRRSGPAVHGGSCRPPSLVASGGCTFATHHLASRGIHWRPFFDEIRASAGYLQNWHLGRRLRSTTSPLGEQHRLPSRTSGRCPSRSSSISCGRCSFCAAARACGRRPPGDRRACSLAVIVVELCLLHLTPSPPTRRAPSSSRPRERGSSGFGGLLALVPAAAVPFASGTHRHVVGSGIIAIAVAARRSTPPPRRSLASAALAAGARAAIAVICGEPSGGSGPPVSLASSRCNSWATSPGTRSTSGTRRCSFAHAHRASTAPPTNEREQFAILVLTHLPPPGSPRSRSKTRGSHGPFLLRGQRRAGRSRCRRRRHRRRARLHPRPVPTKLRQRTIRAAQQRQITRLLALRAALLRGRCARRRASVATTRRCGCAVVPMPIEAAPLPNSPCTPRRSGEGPLNVRAPSAFPPGSRQRDVALIGDSHASHWRAALDLVGRSPSAGAGISLAHSRLPAVARVQEAPRAAATRCVRWNAQVHAWLARHPEIQRSCSYPSRSGASVCGPATARTGSARGPGLPRCVGRAAAHGQADHRHPRHAARLDVASAASASSDAMRQLQRAGDRLRGAARSSALQPDAAAVAAERRSRGASASSTSRRFFCEDRLPAGRRRRARPQGREPHDRRLLDDARAVPAPRAGGMIELAPGTVFAGYRIEAVVGRGGMGVVYRATELALDRKVALKVIAPELAAGRPRSGERFKREARLAASIEHPNVDPDLRGGRGRRAALHRDALRRRRPTCAR